MNDLRRTWREFDREYRPWALMFLVIGVSAIGLYTERVSAGVAAACVLTVVDFWIRLLVRAIDPPPSSGASTP